MIILKENKQIDVFRDKTGISDYDSTMNNSKLGKKYTYREYYKFEKGVESHIEYMTAEKYMDMCRDIVFNSDPYSAVDYNKVNEYADMMRKGVKFDLPYINTRKDREGQEGRHRMLAAKLVYGEDAEFPVLVLTDTVYKENEVVDYINRKYDGYNDYIKNDFINSMLGRNSDEDEPYEDDIDDFDLSYCKTKKICAVDVEIGDIIKEHENHVYRYYKVTSVDKDNDSRFVTIEYDEIDENENFIINSHIDEDDIDITFLQYTDKVTVLVK